MSIIVPFRPSTYGFPCRCRTGTAELHYKAVTRVVELLRSEPTRTLSIYEMARVAYISPFHFIRVFQEVTGIAPGKFHWALKVHAAKKLLLTTDMKIVDIAMEVGYKSLGTFTRRFSELVGISPNRFRHLAKTTDLNVDQGIDLRHAPTNEVSIAAAPISGRVEAPPSFKGTIVVGCFASPLPQGLPLQYAIVGSSQIYQVRRPNHQTYFLCAFGIPLSGTNMPWFIEDNLLRSSRSLGEPPRNDSLDNAECDRYDLTLRTAQPTDPPILLALGALVSTRFRGSMTHHSSSYLSRQVSA